MGLPPSIDLIDGTFTVRFDAAWSGGFGDPINGMKLTSATTKVVAEKLSGFYYDHIVKGFSTAMELRAPGLESVATTQPAPIFVTSIQSGVEVTNLAASFQMRWKLAEERPVDWRHRCRPEFPVPSKSGKSVSLFEATRETWGATS